MKLNKKLRISMKMAEEIIVDSQYIELDLIDEMGKRIIKSNINFIYVIYDLVQIADYSSKYPWLSSIDIYGNTIFNKIQVSILLKELNNLSNDKINNRAKKIIIETISFLDKINEHAHRYIRFVGD